MNETELQEKYSEVRDSEFMGDKANFEYGYVKRPKIKKSDTVKPFMENVKQ